jgi:hypothetical protein
VSKFDGEGEGIIDILSLEGQSYKDACKALAGVQGVSETTAELMLSTWGEEPGMFGGHALALVRCTGRYIWFQKHPVCG